MPTANNHCAVTGFPLPSLTRTFFFKMAPYRTANMNEDIWKFVHDSKQQRARKTEIVRRISLGTFKVMYLTRVYIL